MKCLDGKAKKEHSCLDRALPGEELFSEEKEKGRIQNEKSLFKRGFLLQDLNFVIPLGFEPRTHTLKVYCSTS
jgi:hypothetical protein